MGGAASPALPPCTPKGHHRILLEISLADFNLATIYSIPELKEFRQLLSYPTFQQARLAKILLGDCRHTWGTQDLRTLI